MPPNSSNRPSAPGSDGVEAASILSDYTAWSYPGTGEDPTNPDASGAGAASTARAGAATAAPAGSGPKDWAEWVKRKIENELRRQIADPGTPPGKLPSLQAALARVQAWQ